MRKKMNAVRILSGMWNFLSMSEFFCQLAISKVCTFFKKKKKSECLIDEILLFLTSTTLSLFMKALQNHKIPAVL